MLEYETRELALRRNLLALAARGLSPDIVEQLERRLSLYRARGVMIADEGREYEITRALRKMHVFNPIPSRYGTWPTGDYTRNITTDRIIEDPVFKRSDRSYFVQLADCVAYALLKREVTPTANVLRYGINGMFEQTLTGVCFKPASKSDPLGIVR